LTKRDCSLGIVSFFSVCVLFVVGQALRDRALERVGFHPGQPLRDCPTQGPLAKLRGRTAYGQCLWPGHGDATSRC